MNENGFETDDVVRGLPRTTWTLRPYNVTLNVTNKNEDFPIFRLSESNEQTIITKKLICR
jgi:hypothetical protein